MEISKADFVLFRGEEPKACDYCGRTCSIDELEPEEGQSWVCVYCLKEWETVRR